MSIEILMPALSPTMEEGTLAKWLVKEGDSVQSGDVIAEIETDKATMEVEAVDEGVVGKLLVAEGTEGVAVNTVIAQLLEDGETEVSAPSTPASNVAVSSGPDTDAPDDRSALAAPVAAASSAQPQSAATMTPAEPEWDGPTKTQTLREALRDAMAEEMRTTPEVFVMGEEVAEYQGAYKVTQGCWQNLGQSAY